MEYSEGQYLDQLGKDHRDRLQAGLRDRGLISWQELNFPKEMEDISVSELNTWVTMCEDKGIDPERVVIDDNNLNYKWITNNYKFKAVYFPNELYKCRGHLVKPCVDKIPQTNLNFMAGNYSISRWRLLEMLWKKGLLTDDKKLFWSAYRVDENKLSTEMESLSNEFNEFMSQNVPRTFCYDRFYNKYPEQLDLGTLEQRYIIDFNNLDTWIYENSLVSVVLDTMSNWHHKDQDPKHRFPNVYTTPKTFKAIKHRRPFVLAIAKQTEELAMLRNLGFETFDSVWSEEYDKQSFHKRLDHMADLCYNLSNENITELYHATHDICEHNYNVLMDTDWVEWYLLELDKQYGL
tara:strand:- start:3414 stop:4460 length:1047 start_codon:yes stop_codon:yes gene_type:complete